jgi:hypothetical protein
MCDDQESLALIVSEESRGADGERRSKHKLGKLCWKKSKSSKRWRPVAEAL